LPGETTLDAAAILASNGQLNIFLVIVAGSIGAITGDSAVCWLARTEQPSEARIIHRSSPSGVGPVTSPTALAGAAAACLCLYAYPSHRIHTLEAQA
jgi:hypothetical protein